MRKCFKAAVSLMLIAVMSSAAVFAEGSLTQRLTVSGQTMYGTKTIFAADDETGAVTTTTALKNSDTTVIAENNSITARLGDGATVDDLARFKSVKFGKQNTGKLIFEFDFETNRSQVALRMQYGQSWSSGVTEIVPSTKDAQNGAKHFKAIIDFDTAKVNTYIIDKDNTVSTTEKDLVSDSDSNASYIWFQISDIKFATKNCYGKIDNFTMYKITETKFKGEAANGGAAFNLPIDETLSSAKVGDTTLSLSRMTETETVINTYEADCSALEPGTYEVTVSAVPLGKAAADAIEVKYSAVVPEPLELSNLMIIKSSDSSKVNARVSVKNNTKQATTITMIIAEYADGGRLVNITNIDRNVYVSDETQDIYVSIAEAADKTNNTFKAFVWNGIGSMKPLIESIEQ